MVLSLTYLEVAKKEIKSACGANLRKVLGKYGELALILEVIGCETPEQSDFLAAWKTAREKCE